VADVLAPTRILVVDDHPMMRDGIVGILGRQDDMEVVAEAKDGLEAIDAYIQHRPDVTLLDIQMPGMDGIEAIRRLRAIDPAAMIIVLTTYAGDTLAVEALRAGAGAYLLKNCIRRDLVDTVRGARQGKQIVAPEIAQQIALHAIQDRLTEREIAVLRCVSEGSANKEIARRLSVSPDTIKADLKSIFAKLDVSDRTHAVVVAVRRGYLTL
jgi:DNA-binding NarL/FixJ family response regulator